MAEHIVSGAAATPLHGGLWPNRTGDGSLPSGKQIADRYGRHERWGRLTKRAGTAGELSHHGPDTRLMNLRRSDERLCAELPDRRGQQLIGHDREGGQLG